MGFPATTVNGDLVEIAYKAGTPSGDVFVAEDGAKYTPSKNDPHLLVPLDGEGGTGETLDPNARPLSHGEMDDKRVPAEGNADTSDAARTKGLEPQALHVELSAQDAAAAELRSDMSDPESDVGSQIAEGMVNQTGSASIPSAPTEEEAAELSNQPAGDTGQLPEDESGSVSEAIDDAADIDESSPATSPVYEEDDADDGRY